MDPISIIIFIVILLFSVIFHEVAHGLMAEKLGDPTARYAGRLTLNPIPHIDPLWSIILPAMMLYFNAPILFGAAKPVPVDFRNFRNIKVGMFLVAIIGPVTNLVLAGLAAAVYLLTPNISETGRELLVETSRLNIILFLFNLIPVPPLDGSKVLASILGYFDRNLVYKFLELERYGFIFIIILLLSGLLDRLLIPPYVGLINIMFNGIPPEMFTPFF